MSTRTRSRTVPTQQVVFKRYPYATPTPSQPGHQVQLESHSAAAPALEETITDDPIRGGEKSCKHYSRSTQCRIFPVVHMNIYLEAYSSRPYKAGLYMHYTNPYTWDLPTMQKLGEAQLKELATDALRQMQPSMNEGLSLVNFLIELKDVKRMFHLWDSRTRGGLKAFVKALKDKSPEYAFATGSKEFAKLLTYQSAAYNLNWNFGWKPFISDLIGMYKALANFEKKYKWLVANQGKLLRRNYRRELDLTLPVTETGTERLNVCLPNLGIPNTHLIWTKKEWRWVAKPMYHATLIYRYSLPAQNETLGKVKAFMSAIGVELDPSIIWNAIPFSFLLDWVIDVGAFLRQFRVDNLGIKTEVVDFSHSVKFHTVATTSINPSNVSDVRFGFSPMRDDEYSYYERVRTIPSLYTLSVDNPSFKQWTLASSLVAANGKSIRKHLRRASRMANLRG